VRLQRGRLSLRVPLRRGSGDRTGRQSRAEDSTEIIRRDLKAIQREGTTVGQANV
jgi:hypothetical protein